MKHESEKVEGAKYICCSTISAETSQDSDKHSIALLTFVGIQTFMYENIF